MDELIKANDYFTARLLNEQETPGTLVAGGVTADNTKLEDKEFYQNKPKVREIFSDENGVFKQEEFDKFYQNISEEFVYLNALRDQNYAFDFYERNNANYRVQVGRKSNPRVTTELVANPMHVNLGIISGNTWSEPTESARELAQQNQIFDPEQNKWLGETPNDLGFLGVLFGDPLVYATWDSEGYHIDPMSGQKKFHQKGEWKTDQFGNFYTEIADKKSENLNKQFVTASEVLTTDGSAWNTVDIFDSDDIKSSPIKSTIRTALVIGSTFIPYVGPFIKYGTAALEFAKAIPNVAKMLNGFINDESPEWLNHFDNTMARFDRSVSDEASQKGFWAYENIMDLVQTSFMQLVQQQAIANIPAALFKYEDKASKLMKAAEKSTYYAKKHHQFERYAEASAKFKAAEELMNGANKMSDAISKVYLVTTSMTDSYDTARRSGLSQETASYVSLFSMAGMYGLLQTDYMRGLLTNNKNYEMVRDMKLYTTELAKQNIKHLESQGLTSVAESALSNAEKVAWYKDIGKSLAKFWKDHVTSVKSGKFSIKAGMMAEGLEELSEEVMQDSATMLSRGIGMFKASITGKEYEDEYSWKKTNPWSRYSAAFFGGAIGGGIFTTANNYIFQKDAFKNFNDTLGSRSALNKQSIEYILAGKTDELLETLENVKQEMLSSTVDMNGKPTTDSSNSQKEIVFNMMKTAILAMDTFINTNSLGFSKDDFKMHTLIRAGWIKDNSIYDIMLNDYVNGVSDLVQLEAQRQSFVNKLDSASDSEKSGINANIKKIDELIKITKQDVEDLKNGSVEEYMGAIMLKANKNILEGLIPTTKNDLAKLEYNGMEYDALPKYAQEKIDAKFKALDQGGNIDLNVFKAWRRYKELNADKDIKSALNTFNSKFGQNEFYNVSPELLLLGDVIEYAHYDSPIFDYGNSKVQLQQRKDAIARLILHKRASISSEVFDGTYDQLSKDGEKLWQFSTVNNRGRTVWKVVNEGELNTIYAQYKDVAEPVRGWVGAFTEAEFFNQLLDENKVEQYLQELELKAKNAFEFIEAYTKDNELIKTKSGEEIHEIFEIYNRYGELDNFRRAVQKVRQALEESSYGITPANEKGDPTLKDMLQIIPSSELEQTVNAVLKKVGGGAGISFIKNLDDYCKLDPSKFVLSQKQIEELNRIQQALEVTRSLVLGADEKADNEVITGANALILEALKEKGKKGDFMLISSDSAFSLNDYIDSYILLSGFLLDQSRKNQGGLINIDKINSNKRLRNKFDACDSLIRAIKSGGENLWGTWAISLPDLPEILLEETDSEEALKQQNIQLRKAILTFETSLKTLWDNCDKESKKDFVSKILKYYFHSGNADDLVLTGNLEDAATDALSDEDFVKYLWACCTYDSKQIFDEYFKGFSSSDKCPFDSQEEIITQTCKMLLGSNNDMQIWADGIKESLKNSKTEDNVLGVLGSFICSFGVGGCGKSDVIIPEIVRIVKTVDPTNKIVIAVNTDTQRAEMRARFEAIYGKEKLEENVSIILHSEFLEHVKTSISNSENVKYIIDECTNLTPSTLKTAEELIKNANSTIKALLFGDDTQTGKHEFIARDKGASVGKINQIIMPTTLSQSTPVRTVTDISRKNTSVLESHFSHTRSGVKYFDTTRLGSDDYFKYFDDGVELHGIAKNDEITVDTIDLFISTYLADGKKTLMIFTKNENEYDQLSEKYKDNQNVFVRKTIESIQGSQWDYVINLWNQSIDDTFIPDKTTVTVTDDSGNVSTKEMKVLNAEALRLNELGEQVNTLFTRAKFGTISVSGTEWDWETEKSEYPPISIGLSPETITSYKEFKTDVFKAVYGPVGEKTNAEKSSTNEGGTENPDDNNDSDDDSDDPNDPNDGGSGPNGPTDPNDGSDNPSGSSGSSSADTDSQRSSESQVSAENTLKFIKEHSIEPELDKLEQKEIKAVSRMPKPKKVITTPTQGKTKSSSKIPNVASECEFSAAWVPTKDFDPSVYTSLGFNSEDSYAKWRSLIVTLFFAKNEKERKDILETMKKMSNLADGEFGLFKYKEGIQEDQLLPFGNAGISATGKNVTAYAQTWLVYKVTDVSGNDRLLHIAFCHTNQATSEYGLKQQTPLNRQVHSIPEETYVKLPDYQRYHRNTSFDIKPARTSSVGEVKSKDDQTSSKLYVTSSPLFLMSAKTSLDQNVCALAIISKSDTLRAEYTALFKLLESKFGANLSHITPKAAMAFRNYIHRDVSDRVKYKAKGVVDLKDHFCQFKKPFTNETWDLKNAGLEYAAQLDDRIRSVKKLINYINSNPTASEDDLIKTVENIGSVQETVTIVAYQNGKKTNDKDTVMEILKGTDDRSGTPGYRRAIHTQIVRMLCRIEQILCANNPPQEYEDAVKILRDKCEEYGIKLTPGDPNWGRTIRGFDTSSALWGSYFNLTELGLDTANMKWAWSDDCWAGFIAEMYSNSDIMTLLTDARGFRLGKYIMDDVEKPRNFDIKLHGALLENNKILMNSGNSIFSTSYHDFTLEDQFMQIARLCIYGEPVLLTNSSEVSEDSQDSDTPPAPKKPVWKLKDAIAEITEANDASEYIGAITQYIEDNGWSTKDDFETNREMIESYIEDCKNEATQNCHPPF